MSEKAGASPFQDTGSRHVPRRTAPTIPTERGAPMASTTANDTCYSNEVANLYPGSPPVARFSSETPATPTPAVAFAPLPEPMWSPVVAPSTSLALSSRAAQDTSVISSPPPVPPPSTTRAAAVQSFRRVEPSPPHSIPNVPNIPTSSSTALRRSASPAAAHSRSFAGIGAERVGSSDVRIASLERRIASLTHDLQVSRDTSSQRASQIESLTSALSEAQCAIQAAESQCAAATARAVPLAAELRRSQEQLAAARKSAQAEKRRADGLEAEVASLTQRLAASAWRADDVDVRSPEPPAASLVRAVESVQEECDAVLRSVNQEHLAVITELITSSQDSDCDVDEAVAAVRQAAVNATAALKTARNTVGNALEGVVQWLRADEEELVPSFEALLDDNARLASSLAALRASLSGDGCTVPASFDLSGISEAHRSQAVREQDLASQVSKLRSVLQTTVQETRRLAAGLDESEKERLALEKALAEHKRGLATAEGRLQTLTAEYNSVAQARKAADVTCDTLRLECAEAQQRCVALEATTAQLRTEAESRAEARRVAYERDMESTQRMCAKARSAEEFLAGEVKRLTAELAETQSELDAQLQSSESSLAAQRAILEAEIRELRETYEEKESGVWTLESQRDELRMELVAVRSSASMQAKELELLRTQVASLNNSISLRETELLRARTRAEEVEDALGEERNVLRDVSSRLDAATARCDALTEVSNRESSRTASLTKQLAEAQKTIAVLKSRSSRPSVPAGAELDSEFAVRLESESSKCARLQAALNSSQDENSHLRSTLALTETKLVKAEAKADSNRGQVAAAMKDLERRLMSMMAVKELPLSTAILHLLPSTRQELTSALHKSQAARDAARAEAQQLREALAEATRIVTTQGSHNQDSLLRSRLPDASPVRRWDSVHDTSELASILASADRLLSSSQM